jgi:hypothetical protein
VPVPIPIQPRSNNEPGTEAKTIGVGRISPQDFGIVHRNINDLRLGGFDLSVIRFDDDLLLRSTLKNSGLFRPCSQALDRRFHVLWLRDIGLSKRGSPIGIFRQHLQDGRIMCDGLDPHIPVLSLDQVFVHPAVKIGLSL